MSLLRGLFGTASERELKKFRPLVENINGLEPEIEKLSDEELSGTTATLKERLKGGETLDEVLPHAFATVRETSRRLTKERHYDVQLVGGVILHRGNVVEMKTGEGKTLVATLPAYLNALTDKGVHIVTVNDYLARRDAVSMGQIYSFLGLSVGVINGEASYLYDASHKEGSEEDAERDASGYFKVHYDFLKPCTRKEAYEADITYGTNNEFGFDYLRDNIEYKKENIRQARHHFAIVDEVDSILIDEARTPLIISAPGQESESLYMTFAGIAGKLKKDEDFEVDEKLKAVSIHDSGVEKAEASLGIENIYTDKGIKYVHHLEVAVRARALFEKDKHYVVKDGEVIIVDEFTGRLQPGRRWSEGLHQAVEAKEGVSVKQESRTFASITFQNYFRMYEKLSGMTGTALTSKEEFYSVYGLDTLEIPTHRPVARLDKNDLIFRNEQGKFKALTARVKEGYEKGQPILIGTASIERNEELSSFLSRERVQHEVLNAKNHEREGEIIAEAGKKGSVTIATNMAGRGVDIKLGGPLATEEQRKEICDLGGLLVIGTERHDARRIDNQLRGRSGRQGDPGETQFFVSLEDPLMRIFATDMVSSAMGRLNIAEDEPIQSGIVTKALESAQTKIEGFHFDSRKQVLAYDDVLNTQRHTVYDRRSRVLTGDASVILSEIESVVGDNEKLHAIVCEKREALGDDAFFDVGRRLILQSIDLLWMEHLEVMEYTRSSVTLRAYGQRDPLIEYKKEGLRLFKELEEVTNEQIRKLLPRINENAFQHSREEIKEVRANPTAPESNTPVVRVAAKIGRNQLVTISNGTETKEVKYKKAEPLLKAGQWKIVQS